MVDENDAAAVSKVRRSIFISQELEASLARLAEEHGTTVNELISQILLRGVADLEAGPQERG